MEKYISYPVELIEQIGGYLATRPYQEVFKLITALQQQGKPLEEQNDADSQSDDA